MRRETEHTQAHHLHPSSLALMTRTPHPSVSSTFQPGTGPCFRVAHAKTSVCFIWKHRSHMVRPSPNAIHTLVYLSVHKTPLSPSPSRLSNPPTYTKIDTLLHHQSSCRPPPPFTLNTHFQQPPATSGFFHKTRFPPKKRLFTSFSTVFYPYTVSSVKKKDQIRTTMYTLYLIRNETFFHRTLFCYRSFLSFFWTVAFFFHTYHYLAHTYL
jgi:hypothetical protein